MTPNWFRVENKADDPTLAEIHIIDFIGGWTQDMVNRFWDEEIGVTARAFVEKLAALPAAVQTLHVHINSPGGDVQAGVNIANALREQQTAKGRTVETFIDGLAASIASVIAMAGSKVHIADNALVMVHNPWAGYVGNAADFRKVADVLDTMRKQIVATYRWHSTLDDSAIEALMDAETWMDASEAIARGFATDKVEGLKAAAALPQTAVARLKIPEPFRARVDALLEKPAPAAMAAAAVDVLRVCREGGCLDLAEGLLQTGATLDQVTAKVTTEKTARAAAQQRAEAITAVCKTAAMPEAAAGYIKSGLSLDDVKAHLTTVTAKVDAKVVIDSTLPADGGTTGQTGAVAWSKVFARFAPTRTSTKE